MTEEHDETAHDSMHGVSHSPRHGGRRMEAPILHVDLLAEIEELHQQPSYTQGNLTGRTLVKGADLRVVLMALRTGGRMPEHVTSGPCSIQTIAGKLAIRLPDSTKEMTAGMLLALEAGVRHDVAAVEDSVFLVTIGRTTYEHVSDRHEP